MKNETIRLRLAVLLSFDRPCSAEEFARTAYPDSREWTKRAQRGRVVGGILIRSASGVLGQLRALGLVERVADDRYRISPAGRAFIAGIPATAAEVTHQVLAQPVGQALPVRVWFDGQRHWCCDGGTYLWWNGAGWVPWGRAS